MAYCWFEPGWWERLVSWEMTALSSIAIGFGGVTVVVVIVSDVVVVVVVLKELVGIDCG